MSLRNLFTYSAVNYFSIFQVDGVVKSSWLGKEDVKWRPNGDKKKEEGRGRRQPAGLTNGANEK